MILLILKRFFRRIKYIFKSRYIWEYESCKDCGKCFRINWNVKDEIWNTVMNVNDGSGVLCIDCFIERAVKKNIQLKDSDFTISIFIPERNFDE